MRHIAQAKRLFESNRYLRAGGVVRWAFTLGCAGGIAVAYYAAARFGLAFLDNDVAVFWPASGIAVGMLITLDRRMHVALVIGVLAATVAANLTVDSLWPSLFKGLCYASEPVLTAWLIRHWFGREFAFDDLRRVLGFVAAACFGVATAALGGAATMTLFHTAVPFWEAWRTWLMADWVGIVVVAPLIIELAKVRCEVPSRAESIEGAGVLALLALASIYVATHPKESWISFDPDSMVLPLLLWLTARCQPSFGVAGAFVTSVMVIGATTLEIGRFGDAGVPIIDRVRGAQVAVTMVTLCTLVLAALFAKRKKAEEELRKS